MTVYCDMTGATIELLDAGGTSLSTMPLATISSSGSFGTYPCGDYNIVINNAPSCYTIPEGDVGSRVFNTDGIGTTTQNFVLSFSSIPTVGEWGLIILALLLMSFGSLKIAASSTFLAGTGNRNIPIPGQGSFKLLLNTVVYRKALMLTIILALIGFSICYYIFNTVFLTDILGVAIAGPIFTYLIHLLYILETGSAGEK